MAKFIPSKKDITGTAEMALRMGAGFASIGLGTFALGGQGIPGAIGSIIGAEVGVRVGLKKGQSNQALIVRSIGILNAVDILLDQAFAGRGVIG